MAGKRGRTGRRIRAAMGFAVSIAFVDQMNISVAGLGRESVKWSAPGQGPVARPTSRTLRNSGSAPSVAQWAVGAGVMHSPEPPTA